MLNRLVSLEAFLIQIILYLLLWLWNDYLATILSMVFGGIALAIWLLSLIIENVEKSKVPKNYYRLMVLCFLAPLVSAIIGFFLKNGMSWMIA